MEKRKELEEGDIICCPHCGSDDLDCDEAPSHAKCNKCGQEMRTKTVLIWESATVKLEKGAGVVSVQVWTDKLPGRPFPAWAVLVDIKEDGTFLCNPKDLELIELRRQIIKRC